MRELEENRDMLQHEVDVKAELVADLQGIFVCLFIYSSCSQTKEVEIGNRSQGRGHVQCKG